jgi:hypothetical protein
MNVLLKASELFYRKLNEYKQKKRSENATIIPKPLFASFKVASITDTCTKENIRLEKV